ncbi:MAG: hypothetical protein WC593_15610 [Methanoregula sp.]
MNLFTKLITVTTLTLTAACASLESPRVNYLNTFNRVRQECGKGEAYKTPPIVFVRDHAALRAMFPNLEPGERLLGVQWGGVVYLSEPDVDRVTVAHEFCHVIEGGNEARAYAVGVKVGE